MSSRLSICVVTTSRADYGLLKFFIEEISKDPYFDLRLVVSGVHLDPEFGLTATFIEKDGFEVHQKIELLIGGGTESSITKSVGVGIISFAEYFSMSRPDCVLILGDRFELLSVAVPTLLFRIPLIHVHGGELTEGALDDCIRHSISKMSNFHFVSCEEYRRRVIQLGEQPDKVFNVGALGLDYLSRLPNLDKLNIEHKLGLEIRHPLFLVTFHSPSCENNLQEQVVELLAALENFPQSTVIFTGVHPDLNYLEIKTEIENFVQKNCHRARNFASLGSSLYLNLLKICDATIGNSSSGIIEAPYLKKPVVNIGTRQDGRVQCSAIINCEPDRDSIFSAIRHALSDDFCHNLKNDYPYGEPGAANKIIKTLKEIDFKIISKKRFYDFSGGTIP